MELSTYVQLVLLPAEGAGADSADVHVRVGEAGDVLSAAKHDPTAWAIVTAHVLYVYRELRMLMGA